MIKLSKYTAYSQKKKTKCSTRCVGRILVWSRGEVTGRYIGQMIVYDDESVMCRGKYSDTEESIHKAQEELDDLADSRGYKYQGQNNELPIYNYCKFGGGYLPA